MPTKPVTQNDLKRAVGYAAADLIEEGMTIGLGTGSTATFFIDRLIERVGDGLILGECVASSERSAKQAAGGGLRVVALDDAGQIDITVDGADEMDPQKRMIKGGGGALLREKLLAAASREMIVIIDESKLVDQLGAFPLPVEIIRFGYQGTLRRIRNLGFDGALRMQGDTPFVTDEGHYTVDLQFPNLIEEPEEIHQQLISTIGVVDTGFFFGLAGRVIIGRIDGKVEIKE
jgi:ribose 5-phosphate isomerase A